METYKEKVAKGVEWLNKNHYDWKREINVSILNMNEYDSCILGQLFGDYAKAEKFLGENFCIEHGFKYGDNTFDDDSDVNNRLLDIEWEAILEQTFDLSKVSVKPGLYEIVNSCTANDVCGIVFKKGCKVLVINISNEIDVRFRYSGNCVLNIVLYQEDNALYLNCPILVKRVKEST